MVAEDLPHLYDGGKSVAQLQGADLPGADLEGAIRLDGVDLKHRKPPDPGSKLDQTATTYLPQGLKRPTPSRLVCEPAYPPPNNAIRTDDGASRRAGATSISLEEVSPNRPVSSQSKR